MKYQILLSAFLIFWAFQAKAQDRLSPSTWLTQIDLAQQEAKTKQQKILVLFSGSDWCKPCMLLKREILDHPDFLAYADDHLTLLQVDFPAKKKNKLSAEQTKHNETLAERYNSEGQFPMLLLLDAVGKELSRSAYHQQQTPVHYIDWIKKSGQP